MKQLLSLLFFFGLMTIFGQQDSLSVSSNDSTLLERDTSFVEPAKAINTKTYGPKRKTGKKEITKEPEGASITKEQKEDKGFDASKLTFGGNAGAGFGDYAFISLAPRIGYYFTKSTVLGTQILYRYSSQKVGFQDSRLTGHAYGTGIWGRQYILKRLFFHAEWEALNTPRFYYTSMTDSYEEDRQWYNSVMLGGGFFKGLGGRGGMSFSALYIVNYKEGSSPYSSPWVIRIGAYF